MKQNLEDLYDFIDRAVKSRKYLPATGHVLRSALKLFEHEVNDEERNSLAIFQKNLEQIYHSVATKNGKKFSASSLATYKSRVIRLLADFEKYGADPTKMAAWNPPKPIVKQSKKQIPFEKQNPTDEMDQMQSENSTSIPQTKDVNKLEIVMESGKKMLALIPTDATPKDIQKIKAMIDLLVI